MPPSRTAASRYSYIHDHNFPRFQNLKNPSATRYPYCRDLTSLCLRLCTLVKLREKAGPPFSRHITWPTPVSQRPMTLIYYPDDARRTLVYPSVYPDGKTPNTPKTRVFCFFPLFFCVCSLLNKPTVPENGTHHTAAVVFYESEWLHTAIHRYTALYIIQLYIICTSIL